MDITESNKKWLKQWHPKLGLKKENNDWILEGTLKFRVGYNKKKKKYLILDADEVAPENTRIIEDDYNIRISFRKDGNFFREAQEIGGKIEETAEEKGINDLRDLHFNKHDKKVCLIGHLDENFDISFEEFIDGAVLQFFYDQSHFKKYDKWPRKYFSHGFLGLLENFLLQSKKEASKEVIVIRCLEELRLNRESAKSTSDKIKAIKERLGNGEVPQNFSYENFKILEEENEENQKALEKMSKFLRKKKNNNGWTCITCKGQRFLDCHGEAFLGLKALKRNMKKYRIKMNH